MKKYSFVFALLLAFCVCGCTDDTQTASSTRETERKPVATIATTESKPPKNYSSSEAQSLAEKYVKEKYDNYSPVVIGDVSVEYSEVLNSYDVRITGHYWEKDKYGHTLGSKDFRIRLTVDARTGRVY